MYINLKNGQPSLNLLPTEMFLEASEEAFSGHNAAKDILQYAPERGNTEFLENLASFLTKEYNTIVSSRNLCVTPGASLSLQHILSLLTRPQTQTRYAYFQDPTYFLAFDIFLNVGFTRDQFVGVPDNMDGMDLDVLEEHLERTLRERIENKIDYGSFDSVLYCVPTHANPTGSILSEEKRQRLVDLAKKYNMLVVCDDVYDLLTYRGKAPKRVAAYDIESSDKKPVVISNCTFSKLLAPGARVGWIEASEEIIKKLGDCGSFISGGCPAQLSSQIVNVMLKNNALESHIQFLRKELSDRLYIGLWEPIQEHLIPLGCRVALKPNGGYFIWLTLPFRNQKLVEIIKDHNLQLDVGVGELFRVQKPMDCDIRLSFSHYDVSILQEAIGRLKQAVCIGLK